MIPFIWTIIIIQVLNLGINIDLMHHVPAQKDKNICIISMMFNIVIAFWGILLVI